MADISYSINARVADGAFNQTYVANNVTADMATAGVLSLTLDVGTSTQQISTSTINVLGLCFARNLSTVATHTVTIGRLDSGTLYGACRLKGQEAALFRMSPGDYAAEAAADSTRLLINIIED